ncbi:MAG: 16S rRNA (cytosine(967)-C(5))-methyltransferase RsmB [Gammaproteobacteria bacterium]|nr:16S rRNA (cytosine(967)-C(5))-methyltransferase RsmB [Gammaproteobacteria bacterium]
MKHCLPGVEARAVAARIALQVVDQGRSLDDALEHCVAAAGKNCPRALVQEISYGVVRHYWSLERTAAKLIRSPIRNRDRDVHALVLVGLYQLRYMRVPPHAAVSETVEAAAALHKPWAKTLVNGVLRAFLRKHSSSHSAVAESSDDHPRWLRERIKAAWPDHWRTIFEVNNQPPLMMLRVNLRAISGEQYLQKLEKVDISGWQHPYVPSALALVRSIPVRKLPGFEQGLVSVQDVAAQRAAYLLDLTPGLRVLDACAAPGGKTAHCLELQGDLEIVALDRNTEGVERLQANLSRLGFGARCVVADACARADWWDGMPFDRILIDAPCSATGVIRRHPDIKHNRIPADVAAVKTVQRQLLQSLWPLLAPGGKLLYVTCSILPDENEEQIACFLQATPDAGEVPLVVEEGIVRTHGIQLLPQLNGGDGFFYACLTRVGSDGEFRQTTRADGNEAAQS